MAFFAVWCLAASHFCKDCSEYIIFHVGHGVFDRFAAKNVVSGCKTGFGIQSGFLLQLRVLIGESRFRPNLR